MARPSHPRFHTPDPHSSRQDQAAIEAGDVDGVVARQERDEAGDVFARARPGHRNVAHPFGHQLAGLVGSQKLAPGHVVIEAHMSVSMMPGQKA